MSTTYVKLSTSCCLSWNATLVPSLPLIYWSYNLPLRHSLACYRCCLIASSWNLPANVSDHLQHFDFFRDVKCVHDENTLLALDDFYYHRQHPWLPFITNLSTLWIQLALQLVLCSALKYYCLLCRECCGGIAPPLRNFSVWWYFSLSPFFLGPRVVFNRDTNMLTMLFEFCTSSNPIALKLMVGHSFLDYWLLNHHSDVGRATQPTFRVHLSTNV